MKKRFEDLRLLYAAFVLLIVKVVATFVCFVYNPLLPATFPSVLYLYIFIFSLFSTNFNTALQFLPSMFIGASLPAIAALILARINRKGAGLATFFLALLSGCDILFILVHPLTNSWLFAGLAIALNVAIITCLGILNYKNPPQHE